MDFRKFETNSIKWYKIVRDHEVTNRQGTNCTKRYQTVIFKFPREAESLHEIPYAVERYVWINRNSYLKVRNVPKDRELCGIRESYNSDNLHTNHLSFEGVPGK